MKNYFLIFVFFLLSVGITKNEINSSDNTKPKFIPGVPNPAACYCKNLGYKLTIEKTFWGEEGICILPNGKRVDEWKFYRGEIYPEFNYCGRNGYKTLKVVENADSYLKDCIYCIKTDSLNNIIQKIDMWELMKQNGDTSFYKKYNFNKKMK